MNRKRRAILALGLVAILAFGAGAATIDATTSGVGGGSSGKANSGNRHGTTEVGDTQSGVFSYFDDRFFRNQKEKAGEGSQPRQDPSASQNDGNPVVQPLPIPTTLLAVLGAALVGITVLVFRGSDGKHTTEPEPDDADDGGTLVEVGHVAGRGAERLTTDSPPENAIYRTWLGMTRHLDVERPASTTPTDFARAAVEAGMRRDDVDVLTDVFETVRYGGAAVTEERRERATAAFRRIEAAYGDGKADPAGGENE